MPQMKLCSFVKPELEYFEKNCNFTETELWFFYLRSKDKSLIEICLAMNISESTASRLSKAVNRKIIKVI